MDSAPPAGVSDADTGWMAALETALARLQNRLVRAPAPAAAPAAAAPLLSPSDVPTPPIVSAPAPSPAPTADRSIQSILSVLPSYQIDTPVQEPRAPQPFQVYNQVVIQKLPPTPVPARPLPVAPVVAYKPPSRMPLLSSTLPSYPSYKPQLGATYPTPPMLAATPQHNMHVSPYHLIPTPTVAAISPPPADQQHDQTLITFSTLINNIPASRLPCGAPFSVNLQAQPYVIKALASNFHKGHVSIYWQRVSPDANRNTQLKRFTWGMNCCNFSEMDITINNLVITHRTGLKRIIIRAGKGTMSSPIYSTGGIVKLVPGQCTKLIVNPKEAKRAQRCWPLYLRFSCQDSGGNTLGFPSCVVLGDGELNQSNSALYRVSTTGEWHFVTRAAPRHQPYRAIITAKNDTFGSATAITDIAVTESAITCTLEILKAGSLLYNFKLRVDNFTPEAHVQVNLLTFTLASPAPSIMSYAQANKTLDKSGLTIVWKGCKCPPDGEFTLLFRFSSPDTGKLLFISPHFLRLVDKPEPQLTTLAPKERLLSQPIVEASTSTASDSTQSDDSSSDSSSSSESFEVEATEATTPAVIDYSAILREEEAERQGWQLHRYRLMLHIVATRRGASLSEVVADLAPCYPGAVRTIAADLDADLSATRLLVLRDERYFLRDPSVQPTAEAATEARAHAMNMIAEEERNITRGLGIDSVLVGNWSPISWELSRLLRAAIGLRGATENQILRRLLPFWCGLLMPDSNFCFPPMSPHDCLWEAYVLPHLVTIRALRRGDLYALSPDTDPPSDAEVEALRRESRLRMLATSIFGREEIAAPMGIKLTASQSDEKGPLKIKLRRKVTTDAQAHLAAAPSYTAQAPVSMSLATDVVQPLSLLHEEAPSAQEEAAEIDGIQLVENPPPPPPPLTPPAAEGDLDAMQTDAPLTLDDDVMAVPATASVAAPEPPSPPSSDATLAQFLGPFE